MRTYPLFLPAALLVAAAAACGAAGGRPDAARTATVSPEMRPVRYVAIGASDTVGVGSADPASGAWPARVAALLPPGSAFVNLGVSGSTAAQAREQQLPRAIAQRPTAVSVWLAVNDLNAQVAPAQYRESLAAIVDALVERTEATVFVGNVPDLRPVPAYQEVDRQQLFALITAYNDAVATVVSRYGRRAVLVDLYTGSAPLVSTITVSADGFHPSDEGYRLIAERFANAMRAAGVPLR